MPYVSLSIVRVTTALILVIHGVARTALGIVDDFGVVLGQWGFPVGFALAWTITSVEVVGGTALAAGYWIRPLAVWFVAQLALGICFVHASAGWFVVGAGRNGMEFSVLLIACLVAVAVAEPSRRAGLRRTARQTHARESPAERDQVGV